MGPGAGTTVVVVGQGKAAGCTAQWGDLGYLTARDLSLPTLHLVSSLPLPVPSGFPFMLIRFCSLFLPLYLSVSSYYVPFLLLLSFCRTFPFPLSIFFLSSTFPSSHPFSYPSSFPSYLILLSSHFSSSPPFLFYFTF